MRTTSHLSFTFGLGLLLAVGGAGCGGDDDMADDDDDVACEGAVVGEADGCCPDGANANTDEDCSAECGNNETEDGETCDDGNTDAGDGCDGSCQLEASPTAYRIATLALRDPHLSTLGFDVTDTVNSQIQTSLTADDPVDGFLDLAIVIVFRPVAPGQPATPVDTILGASCTAPVDATSCSAGEDGQVVETTATNEDGGCLAPPQGTTGGYEPPVGVPGAGRCFSSDPEAVTIEAAGVLLSLTDAQVAAVYGAGDPPDVLTEGLFMGFMTEADAAATTLPADLPVVGGMPLTALLSEDDMDTGPGGDGWWFFFNFTASAATFTEE